MPRDGRLSAWQAPGVSLFGCRTATFAEARGERMTTTGPTSGQGPMGAQALLRSVGLDSDGPVLWGAPVSSRAAGVLVVELPKAVPSAPVDPAALRRWIEGVATLRLDDRRPTVNELAARLDAFWPPDQTVIYIGHAAKSLGGRAAALYATGLGERKPHPGGHWLRTLRGVDKCRVWWAETDAPEEYADALFGAFAAGVDPATASRLRTFGPVLPFANRDTPTGQRKEHGIAGFLLAEGASLTTPAGRTPARRPLSSLTGTLSPRARAAASTARAAKRADAATRIMPPREVVSAEGIARLRRELDELINVQRPAVIGRVKAARELGDLRENADYESARNEQSFLEGRIQAIQSRVDMAEVAEANTGEGGAVVGSTVIVEEDGERLTFTLVGAGEADPTHGRISYASPVGRALMGGRPGDEVVAALPGHDLRLRIVEVS